MLSGLWWLAGLGYLAVSAAVAWLFGQVARLGNRRDPRPPLRLVRNPPPCGELRPGRGYACTLRDGHPADHLARDGEGRLLATWPRLPGGVRMVDVEGGRLEFAGRLTDEQVDAVVREFARRLEGGDAS